MAVHLWVKPGTPPRQAPRPLGYRKRRRSNAALISDFKALGKSLFLCASCEWKMPTFWRRRYGYWRLPNYHAQGRCDYCQHEGAGDLFVDETGGYAQGHFQQARIVQNAAQTAAALRNRRR